MRSGWQNNILTLLMLFLSFLVKGQVSGYIYDIKTKNPLEFCNVFNTQSTNGTITDLDGKFTIDVPVGSTLSISFIGYKTQEYIVQNNNIGKIYLIPISLYLQEVTVSPDENPATVIMKRVIKKNKVNKSYNTGQYRNNHLKIYLKDKKNSINPLNKSVLFQQYSDSLEKGVPIYISTQNYKNNNLIMDSSYGVGVNKQYFKEYINSIDFDFDIQSNIVNIFGRGIVTPISKEAFSYYKYSLLDSVFINNEYCYKIKVEPKNNSNVTFYGDIWINKFSDQLQKARLSLNSSFINYINDISLNQDFNNRDSNRFQSRNYIQFSLKLSDLYMSDSLSIFVQKECTWATDSQIENDSSLSVKDSLFHQDISIIKSLINDSHIKLVTKLTEMFVSSYYTINMIDIGPIYEMNTNNKIEGQRVSLMMRTNENLFNNALILGYLGQGFKDKRIKYGFQIKIRNKEKNSLVLSIGRKSDIEFLGSSFINNFLSPNRFNNNSSENIFSSLFKRVEQEEMIYIQNNEASLMKEFYNLDVTLYYSQNSVEKNKNLFINNNISRSSIGLKMRYNLSKKVKNHFDIINVKSHLPIFFTDFNVTNNTSSSSSYNIVNAKFATLHTINTSLLGRTKYLLDLGIIISNDSYSILDLELHRGNQSYIYDFTKSSLMNKYEFISDRYAAIYLQQHLNGSILNKIPIIKRMELREVFVSNIILGNVHDKSNLVNLPSFTTPLSYKKPYIEVGIGLENIFKVFRINAIWRLTYLDNNDSPSFGVLGGMYFIL
jgi:hypothetical protein